MAHHSSVRGEGLPARKGRRIPEGQAAKWRAGHKSDCPRLGRRLSCGKPAAPAVSDGDDRPEGPSITGVLREWGGKVKVEWERPIGASILARYGVYWRISPGEANL